jgi:hypothetical protein
VPAVVTDRAAWGPLTGGLLLASVIGCQNLFGSGDAGFGLALVAVLVAIALSRALPPLPGPYRRALVAPYVLVSASFFNGVIGEISGLFDLRGVSQRGLGPALAALPPALGLGLAFCAVYYVMLVYAPRQLAQPDGGPLAWLARFALFVVAEVVAVSLFAGTA